MKIRLYAQPPGGASMLIEVDLPEGDGADPVRLRCFSPPPNDQAQITQYGGAKAWAVTLNEEDVASLRRLSADVRIVPFGDAKPQSGGWPVELSFASGQAEARLSWWMRAPTAWTVVQQLVTELMDLAQREHTAELSPDDLDGGVGDDVGGDDDQKGFFGRLLGG